MTLFVSYTKSDDAVVRTIRADLEQLGHDVWMDHQIHGGESWWREIIREIWKIGFLRIVVGRIDVRRLQLAGRH